MAKTARTKSFRDEKGNRFIFLSFIIDDGHDAPSAATVIMRAMEMSVIMHLKADDDWFEFDPDNFPHVRSIACSRSFLHGGATVLIFEGPEFDAALAEAA